MEEAASQVQLPAAPALLLGRSHEGPRGRETDGHGSSDCVPLLWAGRPRDYLFGAFNKLWTGEAPNDFENFTDELVRRYSKGCCTWDDMERLQHAVQTWSGTFQETWKQAVDSAVGDFSSCPACSEPRGDREHALFNCNAAKDHCNKWMNNKHYDKKISLIDSLMNSPKLLSLIHI